MIARQILAPFAGALAALLVVLSTLAAHAQGNYTIAAGDTLQIEVLEDASLNRAVLVLPDGTISFPFLGTLSVSGRTVESVRRQLTTGLAPNFAADPTVVVAVRSLAPPATPVPPTTIDVYIMGEVANAGKVPVIPGTTILQFLAESGGLTPFAAKSRVELHRTDASGTTRVYLFSADGRGKGNRIRAGTVLAPGDVVVVPARRLFE